MRPEDTGGIEFSIRPGLPCPETVLVVMLSDGSYLLVGYPQGEPAALTVAKDADPLRRALAGAFEGKHSVGSDVVLPGGDAVRVWKAQS